MPKFYFTFMQKQDTRNNYVCIEAEDFASARDKMVEARGDQWCFQYDERQWKFQDAKPDYLHSLRRMSGIDIIPGETTQADVYHLTEIKL